MAVLFSRLNTIFTRINWKHQHAWRQWNTLILKLKWIFLEKKNYRWKIDGHWIKSHDPIKLKSLFNICGSYSMNWFNYVRNWIDSWMQNFSVSSRVSRKFICSRWIVYASLKATILLEQDKDLLVFGSVNESLQLIVYALQIFARFVRESLLT